MGSSPHCFIFRTSRLRISGRYLYTNHGVDGIALDLHSGGVLLQFWSGFRLNLIWISVVFLGPSRQTLG
jgi:hypothetical protein